MKVILLGPPGAGKGTQAEPLAERLGVPRVSSGDLFRDHQQRDTDLGRLARSYMERGELVPDDVTIKMVMAWISAHADAGGFILDGFPRTLAQAEALDRALGEGIDSALYIDISRDELMRRLTSRLVCRQCQTPYHAESAPPERDGRCDRCGGELYKREDDRSEAVATRLDVYRRQTEPMIAHYREMGVLREVDGENTIDQVALDLAGALNAR